MKNDRLRWRQCHAFSYHITNLIQLAFVEVPSWWYKTFKLKHCKKRYTAVTSPSIIPTFSFIFPSHQHLTDGDLCLQTRAQETWWYSADGWTFNLTKIVCRCVKVFLTVFCSCALQESLHMTCVMRWAKWHLSAVNLLFLLHLCHVCKVLLSFSALFVFSGSLDWSRVDIHPDAQQEVKCTHSLSTNTGGFLKKGHSQAKQNFYSSNLLT